MGFFHPSARVRIRLRVEEFEQTSVLDSRLNRPPPSGDQTLSSSSEATTTADIALELEKNQERLRQLNYNRSNLSQESYITQRSQLQRDRDVLQRKLDNRNDAPQAPDVLGGAPPDTRVFFPDIQPRTVQIERNGIRSADTATIEINHTDAPIDPRLVRGAFVEVVLGTVLPEEFEAGILSTTLREDGMLQSVVGRDESSSFLNPTTRFVGWIDEWDVSFDGDGGDVIRLSCRDMSAIVIDENLPAGTSINMNVPIVQGITDLFEEFPSLAGIGVKFGRPGEEGGVGPVPSDAVPSIRKARRGRVSKRARQGDQRMTVWDHITDVTVGLGLVPIFFGYELHIINPRTLYSDGDVPKRMVYGRNLKSLTFSRKLRGTKVPTIEVRSYDSRLGRTRWARHPVKKGQPSSGVFGVTKPPRALRANEVGVSGASPSESIQTYTVSGITDSEALERVAESIFQQIGRQEIEGNFETADIDSVGVEQNEGDILDLNAGDAVELLIAADTSGPTGEGANADAGASTMQRLQSMSRERRVDYFRSLGFGPQLAQQVAALQDATAFQTTFRVQNVRLSWDTSSGLGIKVDFINFIVVREQGGAEGNATQQAPPSADVSALVGDRDTAASRRLVTASSERATLDRDRAEGRIPEEEYQQRREVALEREKQAVRQYRAS